MIICDTVTGSGEIHSYIITRIVVHQVKDASQYCQGLIQTCLSVYHSEKDNLHAFTTRSGKKMLGVFL